MDEFELCRHVNRHKPQIHPNESYSFFPSSSAHPVGKSCINHKSIPDPIDATTCSFENNYGVNDKGCPLASESTAGRVEPNSNGAADDNGDQRFEPENSNGDTSSAGDQRFESGKSNGRAKSAHALLEPEIDQEPQDLVDLLCALTSDTGLDYRLPQ